MDEGSNLDRVIFLTLIVLALWVLTKRRLQWGRIFEQNYALVMFLAFALASVIWSDFPFASFRRWIRDLGIYSIILVVVTDPRPVPAISNVLRRVSSFILFLSLVMIKYYTGIIYSEWTGAPEYIGATTTKNQLGAVCMIGGLVFFWDIVGRWPERKLGKNRRVLIANVIFFVMALRLLMMSDSATSRVCLVIGCLVIMILRSNWAKANPQAVTAAIPITFVVGQILDWIFGISATVAQLLGRDPTLTGRTGMWDALLKVHTNPLLGVGYQSFWMGDRLAGVWKSLDTGFLNEAHNGYLETYLNLGFVGVVLLVVFLISSFLALRKQFTVSQHFVSLGLAFWLVTLYYNFTEAAFIGSPLWSVALLYLMAVPQPSEVTIGRFDKRESALRGYERWPANSGAMANHSVGMVYGRSSEPRR
jgi:O-antigen ligase